MAQATTYKYSALVVELGDGASPEQFDFPCGLNTRALNRSKTLNTIDIPDCDDEDAPAWEGKEVKSLTWSVTGEGVLAEEAFLIWENYFDGTNSKNVKITLTGVGANTSAEWNGKAHLQTYNITGNRGEKVTVSIDLQGDGALVPTLLS